MSDVKELTKELMLDPEFKKEYESLAPEMDITRAILNARINAGLTQIELSEKSGISQADISRLEKGTAGDTALSTAPMTAASIRFTSSNSGANNT